MFYPYSVYMPDASITWEKMNAKYDEGAPSATNTGEEGEIRFDTQLFTTKNPSTCENGSSGQQQFSIESSIKVEKCSILTPGEIEKLQHQNFWT